MVHAEVCVCNFAYLKDINFGREMQPFWSFLATLYAQNAIKLLNGSKCNINIMIVDRGQLPQAALNFTNKSTLRCMIIEKSKRRDVHCIVDVIIPINLV